MGETMMDLNKWARASAAAGHLSAPDDYLATVISELASQPADVQGNALLELGSELRTKTFNASGSSAAQLSEKIVRVLELAEMKLGADPLPANLIASHLYYDKGDRTAAYPVARRAVEKALQHGDMIRQSVGDLVRICIDLQNYAEVESLLKTLVDYEPAPGTLEIALEKDLLQRLPAGAVSDEIFAAYRQKLGG